MDIKSSAYYQREYRRRLREQGLIKKEVWILPEYAKQLSTVEKQFRNPKLGPRTAGGDWMSRNTATWTTLSLYQVLLQSEAVLSKAIQLEMIEGSEPVLHIAMTEFGDLPLFLTVSGEQILVECLLWSANQVTDVVAFNEAVLKTHKYFPLSTISLEPTVQGDDAYFMFGALSDQASISDVLIEIETLASNVLQATEAYEDFLISDKSEAHA